MVLSLLSKWWDQCAYGSHGFTCQRNNIDKICKVVGHKNDKGTKSCDEVPKVVKRAKLQMEGDG